MLAVRSNLFWINQSLGLFVLLSLAWIRGLGQQP
jgi:hypothetical protein